MNLEELINPNPEITAWFEFKAPLVSGLQVELAYVNPDQFARFQKQHAGDDNKTYTRAFLEIAIKNWKGMTFKNVKALVPVKDTKQSDDAEFPFTLNGALAIASYPNGFWSFILDRVINIRYFQCEDELKNSETGPDGT